MRRRLVLAGLGACVCAAAGMVFHTTIARNRALEAAPRALEATDPAPPPPPQLHLSLIEDEFRVVNDAGDILAHIPVNPEEGMFGSRVTLVDAPGGQRLVVGAPFAHTVAPSAGSVWWFDHADLFPAAGATEPVRIEPALATLVLDGAGDGSLLGAGLKMIPDADADGGADVLVGAPGDGLAYLLSGADGTVIRTLEGSRPEGFGAATALGRDETGDGVREHLVASLFLDPAGNTRARRWTFDGATGDLVSVDETPDAPIARYAGDLDGDNAVTDADLTRVLLSVGAIAPTGTLEDINGDAIVDESDVNLVLRDYGAVIEPIGDLVATGGSQHPCMWIEYYLEHKDECENWSGGLGDELDIDGTGTGDDPDGSGDGGGGDGGGTGGSGGSGGTNTGGGWDGSDGGTSGSGGGSCDGLYGPAPGALRIVDRGATYIFNQPHTPDTCTANWQVEGGTATPINASLTIAEVVFGEVGDKIVSTGCTCQNAYIVSEMPIALDAPAIPHPEADQPPFHIVLVNNDNEDAEPEGQTEVFDYQDVEMAAMDDDLVPLTIGPPEHIGNGRFKHGTIRWRLDTVGVRVWYRKSDLDLHAHTDGPTGAPMMRTMAGEEYLVVPDAWITHAVTQDLTLYVEALEPSVTLGDQSVTYTLNATANWQVPGSQELVEYEVSLTNEVRINAILLDLDTDSDNTGVLAGADRSAVEELVEDGAGMKVLVVNRADSDGDDIPDYADGYGAFGPDTVGGTPGRPFAPLHLELAGVPQDAAFTVQFEYSAATLDEITQNRIEIPDILEGPDGGPYTPIFFHEYARGDGHLRIWKQDAYEDRTAEDLVAPETPLDLASLDRDTPLYVEPVMGSASAVPIDIVVKLGGNVIARDTVRALPFDSESGSYETEITGFTIHSGSTDGTAGNDIVIGTASDDVINTGSGDDIVIAQYGQDTIDTGSGSDIVYTGLGQNAITLNIPPPSTPIAFITPDHDQLITETNGTFTAAQVVHIYHLLYGDQDPWLDIYLEDLHGRITTVHGDGWLFSESDWDHDTVFDENGQRQSRFTIQLQFSINSPALAAAHLRAKLLALAGSPVAGANAKFQAALVGERFSTALAQDSVDESIATFNEVRQRGLNNALSACAALADIYIRSIGFASEAADWVITIGDFIDGELSAVDASIAMLPLISSPVIQVGRRAIARTDTGEEFLVRGGDLVEGLDPRALRGGSNRNSGLGLIPRPGFQSEDIVKARASEGRFSLLLGSPQTNASEEHRLINFLYADQRFRDGSAEWITMHRSLKTATGRSDLGEVGTWLPDITVVRHDKRVDLYEIQSPDETIQELVEKLEDMRAALPPDNQGALFLIALDGRIIREW